MNEMNLSEMRKIMAEEAAVSEAKGETAVVGSNWMNASKEAPTEKTEPVQTQEEPINDPRIESEEDYTGKGMIIDKKEKNPNSEQIVYTGMGPIADSSFDSYMNSMEEDIGEVAQFMPKKDIPQEKTPISDEMTEDEASFKKSYEEAVVIIDKSGFGGVIDFTEDEREKLEKVKKIRLEEIETVNIAVCKTKKRKKDAPSITNIIKRTKRPLSTNIVLPLSGYTAVMSGCSAYELMSMIDTGTNALLDAQTKWSIIHSKIETTSIGYMDFNEFLRNTAAADFNNFIYGILCATYPDNDRLPTKCPVCKAEYEHEYSCRSLIRAEMMGDKLRDTFMNVVDNSVVLEDAKRVHENALINQVKAIKLPSSEGIVVEIQTQSAFDLINNSIKSLSTNKDSKFAQAAILSTLINRVLIPDPEDPDVPFEITDAMEVAEVVYNLSDYDIMILKGIGDEFIGDMSIDFGLMDLKCPKCGHYRKTELINPEDLLFYRYRQVFSTSIE